MAYLLRVKSKQDLRELYLDEEIPFKFKSIFAISTFIEMCEKNKITVMSYEIRHEEDEDENTLEKAD